VLKTVPSNPSALAESAVLQLGEIAGPATQAVSRDHPAESSADSLFEHFAWLYIFCREKLFRDDTLRMIRALWPEGMPPPGERLIEFGCGPGFYSCRLAKRFSELGVLGVDRSPSQLKWAREKAARLRLDNCLFVRDNVLDLSHADESFDVLIASRLFTVLPNRDRAIAEMYRVLRPGGRCFVAEPRYVFRASIPLYTMWLLASITRVKNGYREPSKAKVLSARELNCLFASQPWQEMKTWQDGRYQYALCKKG
jgi:ubiquinone/menaquinone biosynthesis C-methylase UbiE